ncbi:hypothetical protein AVEN_196102-1 [Araneus ventricosus]|uniref:Uncharacterized protein n=1 Tax=Araneus ventricosus TaxID=182803 RepID=A0A4Y2HL69_ARAVE|nr:hypothetical protein AVEN_196102-1 [Araneus ventricosus]
MDIDGSDYELRNVDDSNESNDVSFLNQADQVSNLKSSIAETMSISRNSFSHEKDWKRNTVKINRIKGKACMGFKRADPKTTKRIVHDVRHEEGKMGHLETPESATKQTRGDVILNLDRKGKVFLMNFGSQ